MSGFAIVNLKEIGDSARVSEFPWIEGRFARSHVDSQAAYASR
jgi:hypothetical protein